jgi:16S rRNA (adenine1518-N6/adenine1519-N6)-dimethyltransferase
MTAQRKRKELGQHFLHDSGVVQRIVAAIDPRPHDIMAEIGPGEGVLTRELAPRVGSLHAVELDARLVKHLSQELSAQPRAFVYHADALSFDFCRLASGERKLRVVGNLPYQISTPLLFRLLRQLHCLEDMCFMLQKEVVDRLCAAPGSKAYGRLGVMIQWRCRTQRLFVVPPEAFVPPPKVDSAFVRLLPYATAPVAVADESVFAAIVAAVFNQRRKTLHNALKGMLDAAQMEALDIDPRRRGETLTLEEFAALSNAAARR